MDINRLSDAPDVVRAVWLATLVLGIPLIVQMVATLKHLFDIRRSIHLDEQSLAQRREDLRWRKAEMAKKLLDEAWSSQRHRQVLTMLDWEGRVYQDGGRVTGVITYPRLHAALRTEETHFDDDEQFIRDSFDEFFDALTRMQHFASIGLIEFEDVRPRYAYYVRILAAMKPVMKPFLAVYGYKQALEFLERFKAWREASESGEVTLRRGKYRERAGPPI
jgi:hypothetical protein